MVVRTPLRGKARTSPRLDSNALLCITLVDRTSPAFGATLTECGIDQSHKRTPDERALPRFRTPDAGESVRAPVVPKGASVPARYFTLSINAKNPSVVVGWI